MSKNVYSGKTLSEKSEEKLKESLGSLKKELFNLRFQKAFGELKNTSEFAKVRKNVARVKTELSKRKGAKE